MQGPDVEETVEVRRASWKRDLFLAVGVVLTIVGGCCALLLMKSLGVGLFGAAVAALGIGLFRMASPKRKAATASLEQNALVLRGQGMNRRIEAAAVTNGFELTAPRGVVLEVAGGTQIRVPLPERDGVPSPHAVLTALGVDRARRVLKLEMRGQIGAMVGCLMVFFAVWFVGSLLIIVASALVPSVLAVLPFAPLAAASVMTALWYAFLRRQTLVVGRDGVRIEQGLRRRILPFSAIRAVEVDRGQGAMGLALTLTEGTSLELPFFDASEEALRGIADRIRAGMTEPPPEARAAALASLSRGERTVAAWRRDLAATFGEASYRSVPLRQEDLEDLVDDPAAPAEQRLGAAFALFPGAPEATKARLRVAADTTVDPRVRVALLAATEDDEAAQAAAVDALAER
jgi:hypothetical protein